MSLYVYALLAEPPPAAAGFQAVRAGALWAAAVEIDRGPPATELALRAHDQVVRRLDAQARAILPARFGTVVRDAAELEELVAAREAALLGALGRVAGCAQMTLRLFLDGEAPPESTPPADGPGAGYLRARVRALAIPGFRPLQERLRPWVKDERSERQDSPPRVGSAYHLVERVSLAAYSEAVRKAAPPLRVVASGPHPPYAFAEPFG